MQLGFSVLGCDTESSSGIAPLMLSLPMLLSPTLMP